MRNVVCLQVIKIGTSSLLYADLTGIKLSSMTRICETVRDLRKEGLRAFAMQIAEGGLVL